MMIEVLSRSTAYTSTQRLADIIIHWRICYWGGFLFLLNLQLFSSFVWTDRTHIYIGTSLGLQHPQYMFTTYCCTQLHLYCIILIGDPIRLLVFIFSYMFLLSFFLVFITAFRFVCYLFEKNACLWYMYVWKHVFFFCVLYVLKRLIEHILFQRTICNAKKWNKKQLWKKTQNLHIYTGKLPERQYFTNFCSSPRNSESNESNTKKRYWNAGQF